MGIEEILDLTVICLLVMAIVYGLRLNQKINIIRDGRKELAGLFKSFDETIYRAQDNIEKLMQVSNEAAKDLQGTIDKSMMLKDELNMLFDKADDAADRLDRKVKRLQAMLDKTDKVIPDQPSGHEVVRKVAPSNAARTSSVGVSSPAGLSSGPLSPEEVVKLRKKNASQLATTNVPATNQENQGLVKPTKKKEQELEAILTKIAEQKSSKQAARSNDNSTSDIMGQGNETQSVTKTLKALGFGQS